MFEEGGADRGLDVEARQCFVRARTSHRRFGTGDARRDEGRNRTGSHENSAPVALPQTLPLDADVRTGPDIEGITDCGSTWPKMLLAVPRFDCQSESSRGRYAGFRNADAGGRRIDLLDGRLHRWIVIDGVLQRLVQRQHRRWSLLREEQRNQRESQRHLVVLFTPIVYGIRNCGAGTGRCQTRATFRRGGGGGGGARRPRDTTRRAMP